MSGALTVPRGGTNPGRAAQVSVEADQTGAVVAQLGEVIQRQGFAMEADRLSRERGRLQGDLVRDMNALRLEFEQVGDPDVLEQQWPLRIKALRDQYFQGQNDQGRPRVDPRNAEDFSLAFDDLAERHSFAMGQRAIEGRFSQRQANWINFQQAAVQSGANSDPGTTEIILESGDEQIDEMVAANIIDAATGATRKLGLRRDIANASAITMVADDPQGFIEAADDGEFSGLQAATLSRFRVQAQGNLDRRVAAEVRAAEVAANERSRQIGSELADLAKISADGRQSVNVGILDDPEYQAHADWARAQAAVDLMKEQADLAFKTPAQFAELIAAEENRAVSKPYETERLPVLKGYRDDAERGWSTDPIAYATGLGISVPPLPDFADANPDALAGALVQRIAFAEFLTEQGRTKTPVYLSVAEQAALKAEIGVSADPNQRADLALILTETIGAKNPAALGALSGEPVFAHVGGLLAAGGNPATGREIFRGQQVMAEKAIVMPPIGDRLDRVSIQLGGVFAGLSGGVATQANIVATANALYSSRQSDIDPNDDLDNDLYAQALHEVMGGTGQIDTKSARGGIQEIDGQLVALSVGISGRDVDVTMQTLELLFRGGTIPTPEQVLGGWTPSATAKSLALKILADVSPDGTPPFVAGAPIDIVTFQKVRLQAIGADSYRLVYRAAGQTLFLTNEKGRQFEFSLTDLVRRVAQ